MGALGVNVWVALALGVSLWCEVIARLLGACEGIVLPYIALYALLTLLPYMGGNKHKGALLSCAANRVALCLYSISIYHYGSLSTGLTDVARHYYILRHIIIAMVIILCYTEGTEARTKSNGTSTN